MNGHAHRERGSSESARRVALALQLLGAVLVVSSIIVGVFASHAGAAALSNGTVTIKVASSGSVATNPLANDQVVDVSVAPNSTLSRSSLEAAGFPSGAVPIKVLECADLGGQEANLPQKPTDCEPETIDSVPGAQENGSLLVRGYTIYALPDPADLGVSNGTVCDNTSTSACSVSSRISTTSPSPICSPRRSRSRRSGAAQWSIARPARQVRRVPARHRRPAGGASPGVSVPPATLANTGGPTLWPWLLGAGCVLLLAGSALRYLRRPTYEGRR